MKSSSKMTMARVSSEVGAKSSRRSKYDAIKEHAQRKRSSCLVTDRKLRQKQGKRRRTVSDADAHVQKDPDMKFAGLKFVDEVKAEMIVGVMKNTRSRMAAPLAKC